MTLTDNKDDDDDQLLVIGAGLTRTGTMSLQKSLEYLYQKPCYHGFEVAKFGTSAINKWNELCDKVLDNSDVELVREDFGQLFANYSMTTDHPANGFVFLLMRIYPKAKIILTVRDPQKWLASVRSTILPQKKLYPIPSNWIDRLFERLLFGANFMQMTYKTLEMTLGNDDVLTNDLQLVEKFNEWNEKVKKLVPSERLLVFEASQGWEPLCEFLGFPVPDTHPFPHDNDQQELQKYIGKVQAARYATRVIIYTLLVLGIALVGYWLI